MLKFIAATHRLFFPKESTIFVISIYIFVVKHHNERQIYRDSNRLLKIWPYVTFSQKL